MMNELVEIVRLIVGMELRRMVIATICICLVMCVWKLTHG